MPTKRRVVRKPAKPSYVVGSAKPGFKGFVLHLGAIAKATVLSFTSPARFKAYWLSKAGALRIAKLAGIGILLIAGIFLWYAKDLPSPGKVNAKIGNSTTTFYARDAIDANGNVDFEKGTKLYEVHGDENRIVIPFDKIPANVKNATLAIEDKDFYRHGSFSVTGYLRAAYVDITNRGARHGGSTITQQYVKNALLNPNDRSISRKIKELILSIEIGQFYTKDQILSLYLNEIPYGGTAYGIEAACRTYFSDKYGTNDCAPKLQLDEAAMLAAVLNRPSYLSPYGQNQQALINRQNLVLDLMAVQKHVSKDEAEAAKWTIANLTPGDPKLEINKYPSFYSAITAPNFVLTLQDKLEAKYGASAVESGGWKVITTLDPNLQKCAELSIYNPGDATCKPDGKTEVNPNRGNRNYKNLTNLKGSNAALVASDPKTGQVLAMVGSYSFAATQVNVATSQRQPGSSFKPYVYASLFNKNKNGCSLTGSACETYGAGSILDDTVQNFGTPSSPYEPKDFGGNAKVGGPVTVRSALSGSLNIPAVHALKLAGVPQSIALAKSMGITTLNRDPNNYGLSLVLGSGEVKLADHVNAYESFANGGVHYEPTMFLQIRNNKNKIIEDNTKPSSPKRVLDEQVAYIIANIMSDDDAKQYIFGNALQVPGHVGHSQQGKGVAVKTGTTEYFNDAWAMGYTPSIVAGVWAGNNDNAPMSSQAANIAGPIWKSFMSMALYNKPIATFEKPSGLQYLPNAGTAKQKSADNDYFPKWYKPIARKKVNVDKVSGKIATACTPPLAVESRDEPSSDATDDVHSCDDVKPKVSVSAEDSGDYTITSSVTLGTFGTSKSSQFGAKLDVYLDDQIISTRQISASGSYTVACGNACDNNGSYTVKAVVTDSGLYQDQDETTITIAGGGGGDGGGGGSFDASSNATTYRRNDVVTFTWTTDPEGSTSYEVVSGTEILCTSIGLSCTYKTTTLGTKQWYVRGVQSNNRTDRKTFITTAL